MRIRSSVEVGATRWILLTSGRSPAGTSETIRLVAPSCGGVGGEALPAVRLEDRRVRHRDDRRVAHQLAGRGQTVEAPARAHAARECPLRGTLDHWPVGERIGEGEAELDDVGARPRPPRARARASPAPPRGRRRVPCAFATGCGGRAPRAPPPGPCPPAPRGRRRCTRHPARRRRRARGTTRARG